MQGVYITHRTENYCAGEKVDKNNELIRNLGKLIMSRCILHPNSRYETSWMSESAEVRSHIHIRDPAGKQGDQEIERDEAAHVVVRQPSSSATKRASQITGAVVRPLEKCKCCGQICQQHELISELVDFQKNKPSCGKSTRTDRKNPQRNHSIEV